MLKSPALAMLLLAGVFSASAADAKDKKPVDPNKKVCRFETPTGSHFPKSTCHTVAEWQQIDGDNARSAEVMRDQTATRTN